MLSTQTIQNQYDKLTPNEQAKFKQRVIYNIVDSNYGDRITDFTVDPTPQFGTVASGNFSTPRLGGKKLEIDYAIKDNGVTLTPRNLEIIDHDEGKYGDMLGSLFSFAENIGYAPAESFDFARTLQCEKGWACGGACLSKTKKNCHKALNPEHKTYVEWLKTQVERGTALHKGHREEAEKLGLSKPKEKEQTPKKTAPKSKKVSTLNIDNILSENKIAIENFDDSYNPLGGAVHRLENIDKSIAKFKKNKEWNLPDEQQESVVSEAIVKLNSEDVNTSKYTKEQAASINQFRRASLNSGLYAYKNMMSESSKDKWASKLYEDAGGLREFIKGKNPITKEIYDDLKKRAERQVKDGTLFDYEGTM